jgi:hypothetical protein
MSGEIRVPIKASEQIQLTEAYSQIPSATLPYILTYTEFANCCHWCFEFSSYYSRGFSDGNIVLFATFEGSCLLLLKLTLDY